MRQVKHIYNRIKLLLVRLFRLLGWHKWDNPTIGSVPLAEKPPEPAFRQHRTAMFHHNMPKYQPCPFGHGWKRRRDKTLAGARYWCGQCDGSFFVRR